MGYYDFFAPSYDKSVEKYYVEQRQAAIDALGIEAGDTVLDLPCGTGLSFDGILAAGAGRVVGVDFSKGMVKQAHKRIEAKGWDNVTAHPGDARTVTLADVGLTEPVDRLLICLGLTCFPDWHNAFGNLWGLLKPGGRCTVMDIHTPKRGFYGMVAIFAAQADLRRRFWEPLEERSEDFSRGEQPSLPLHGGTIYVATGTKPA